MPKSPESSIETQGVQSTVQPTKQAIPYATEPTQEVRYKRLSHRSMMLAKFSEESEMFSVQISGEKFGDSINFSDVYDEYHPLMALGRAIVMFQNDYTVATIKNIRVFKRVIVPIKPKKNR